MARERNKGESILAFPKDYTILDLETTGVNPNVDKIIELSAIKYRNNREVGRFTTLVNPERRIPMDVQNLTNIRPWNVEKAPKIDAAIRDFDKFLGDDTIVGYNVNFDVNFTYDAMEKYLGKTLNNDFVDVKKLAHRELDLDRYRQVDVVSHYGLSSEGAHRAINDCEMCHAIFDRIKQDVLQNGHMCNYENKQLSFDDILMNMDDDKKHNVSMMYSKDGQYVKVMDSPKSEFVGKCFKRSFGNHTFSKDELENLARGEELELKGFRTKAGNVIDLRGELVHKTSKKGVSYLGFNRTDLQKQRLGVTLSDEDRKSCEVELNGL